jgi:uridine phosphorylase
MLRDLTKADWLNILGIRSDQVPKALILRGTRNLRLNYDRYREQFHNVVEVGSPNGLLEDVLIGEFAGAKIAYASVYGAAMASEVPHLFGVLGTKLVLQTGCCGAWKPGIEAGDLFIATHAGCGEGASRYYIGPKQVVTATLNFEECGALLDIPKVPVHFGRIFTTAALFAEGIKELE